MPQYFVQRDGDVLEVGEDQLRHKLASEELSGLELVRLDGDDQWRPLHELPIFRQAVPHVGDSRDAARRRVAKGFAWHLLIYGVIVGWWLGVTSIPGILWGLFVLAHAAKALPVVWSLAREDKLLPAAPQARALQAVDDAPRPLDVAPAPAPSEGADATASARSQLATEAQHVLADVRAMLARRPMPTDASAAAGLDDVTESLRELEDRIARLSALLATQDRTALEQRRQGAEQALERASDPADQALRRRQIEVLGESLSANERAQQALERLQLRRSLVLEQLQQLRLDLARVEADAPEPEGLGERLDRIRFETEATEEVEALVRRSGR